MKALTYFLISTSISLSLLGGAQALTLPDEFSPCEPIGWCAWKQYGCISPVFDPFTFNVIRPQCFPSPQHAWEKEEILF